MPSDKQFRPIGSLINQAARDAKRIAELEAQIWRLQAYIVTIETAIPIVAWDKHKAKLLHPGDLDPIGDTP